MRAGRPTPAHASEDTRDDLERISGIGPAIARRLESAGISTYGELAESTPAALSGLLAGIGGTSAGRIAESDWIGQARRLTTQRATGTPSTQVLPPAPSAAPGRADRAHVPRLGIAARVSPGQRGPPVASGCRKIGRAHVRGHRAGRESGPGVGAHPRLHRRRRRETTRRLRRDPRHPAARRGAAPARASPMPARARHCRRACIGSSRPSAPSRPAMLPPTPRPGRRRCRERSWQ